MCHIAPHVTACRATRATCDVRAREIHVHRLVGCVSRKALLRRPAVLKFVGYDVAIKCSNGELPSERREQRTEARFALNTHPMGFATAWFVINV